MPDEFRGNSNVNTHVFYNLAIWIWSLDLDSSNSCVTAIASQNQKGFANNLFLPFTNKQY